MSLACVGSTRSVLATLGLSPLTACMLSQSTLVRLQVALQGVSPELHALSSPKPLRFRFSGTAQRCRLSWTCVLCLPRPSSSGNQEFDESTLLRCSATSLLPVPASVSGRTRSGAPCVSSRELISGWDPPSRCQPSRISGSLWLETGSLFAVW